MLEMLFDDPMKNIDILLLARENNDVDTAPYANTTIAKIQRDFQLQVQQIASAYESEPDNVEILDKYIEILGKFIESGLLVSYLLRRQQLVYSTLLDKKISLAGWNKDTLQEKIHNALATNDINSAIEANLILHENYPNDEKTWINELQISVAGHDRVRLSQTVEAIKNKRIDWSISGKEQVSMWVEV